MAYGIWVCLQNFCSFLERDHGNMDLDSVRSRTNGHPQGNSFHNSMLTPPWSGGCRSPPVDTGITGSPPEYGTAYHRLPSSQILNNSQQMTSFDEESQSELLRLSAGRLERLAACLEPIRPLHVVFRDHSCYQHRPALLLFWFLQLVRPSLRRITLDGIQSDTRITLHKVMSMQGIEELTIKQPATRPALCVVHNLFLDWLALPAEKRRKVRIRLTGCKDLTARGLASFLNTWRSTVDACLFDSISIDLRSIRVNDFISEVERPIKECEESEWRPPTPPAPYGHGPLRTDNDVTDKKITIKHKKGTAIITTDIVEGYLVLSCSSMQPIRSAPSMPLVGFGRLPRTLSANSFDYRSPTRTSVAMTELREALGPYDAFLFKDESMSPVFCKPKLLPLKTVTMQKLERMQRDTVAKVRAMDKVAQTTTQTAENSVSPGKTDIWSADD
uniref:F-box domain-containing protein n=1 Tax=Heterorhabditis bacteriophora TaxID=37862 RepID=A0A1I7XLI6_HETBA